MRSKAQVTYIQTGEDQILYFRERENRAFMTGLCLAGAVCHTNPWAALVAHENKLVQHGLARAVGFEMPQTLFSSSEPAITRLLETGAGVVSKPLSTGLVPRPRLHAAGEIMMMTNRFDKVRLSQPGFSVEIAPVIYQAEVNKRCEMRVLATCQGTWAYRLQETAFIPGSQVDWRRAQAAITGEPAEVPEAIDQLCRAYLQAAGLDYGVMDFIIDKRANWVFLECNGDGQWVFLERESGPFTAAMASLLTQRLESASPPV